MKIDKKILISSLLKVGGELLFMTGMGLIIYGINESKFSDMEKELNKRIDSLEKSKKNKRYEA